MDIISIIRKTAKSDYYQHLFALGKELHSIQIFDNVKDFSEVQILFLKYLSFYASINMDIALNEIDTRVLEDEIYEDSYMMWKNQKDKKKPQQYIHKPEVSPTTKWVFKTPKKAK